jgi:lysyl-tRNA synthetase class II
MKKAPEEQMAELLKQKLDKRTKQSEKEKCGYDAGWIDALKFALHLLEKK